MIGYRHDCYDTVVYLSVCLSVCLLSVRKCIVDNRYIILHKRLNK